VLLAILFYAAFAATASIAWTRTLQLQLATGRTDDAD
jgi:hypothetical protein